MPAPDQPAVGIVCADQRIALRERAAIPRADEERSPALSVELKVADQVFGGLPDHLHAGGRKRLAPLAPDQCIECIIRVGTRQDITVRLLRGEVPAARNSNEQVCRYRLASIDVTDQFDRSLTFGPRLVGRGGSDLHPERTQIRFGRPARRRRRNGDAADVVGRECDRLHLAFSVEIKGAGGEGERPRSVVLTARVENADRYDQRRQHFQGGVHGSICHMIPNLQ